MSVIKLESVKKSFMKNLEKGFIKLSIILYTLPILFVIKKNGTKCFCINYRKLLCDRYYWSRMMADIDQYCVNYHCYNRNTIIKDKILGFLHLLSILNIL